MDRHLDNLINLAGASSARFLRFLRLLRAARCLGAATLLLSAVLMPLFGAAAYVSSGVAAREAPVVRGEDPWRYKAMCAACGYQVRTSQHPAQLWPQQRGLLRCPRCGAFEVTWWRRGSQSVPPGGWDVPGEGQAQP